MSNRVFGRPLSTANHPDVDFDNSQTFEFSFDLGLKPEVNVDILPENEFVKYNVLIEDSLLNEEILNYQKRVFESPEIDNADMSDIVSVELKHTSNEEATSDKKPSGFFMLKPQDFNDKAFAQKFIKLSKGEFLMGKVTDLVTWDTDKVAEAFKIKAEDLKPEWQEETFEITLLNIRREGLAELNEELYDKAFPALGIQSETEFRDKFRQEIANAYQADADFLVVEDALKHLFDHVEVTLPEQFITRLMQSSAKDEADSHRIEHHMQEDFDALKKIVVMDQILENIGEDEVNMSDIMGEARLDIMAYLQQIGIPASYFDQGKLDEMAKDRLKDQESADRYARRIREKRVRNYLQATVKPRIETISVADFKKKFEQSAEQ